MQRRLATTENNIKINKYLSGLHKNSIFNTLTRIVNYDLIDINNVNTINPYKLWNEIIDFPLTMDKAINMNWLDEYDINDIATSLVHRLRIKDQNMKMNTVNYFEQIELQLCFSGNIVGSLIESGEFLNTHQTKTSNGYGDKKRAIVEASFLELPFELFKDNGDELDYRDDIRLHFLRPKYAYCHDKSGSNIPGKILTLQYGSFAAVLEDHVKHRATFTYYDSLTPIIENPTHTFYSSYKNVSPYEGQVYGHISIKEDVKHFIVNPIAMVFETHAIDTLKIFNKPIFNSVTQNVIFTPASETLSIPEAFHF